MRQARLGLELWPKHDPTQPQDALAFMRAAGLTPDPWQVRVATTSGDQLLLCHRQSGKSTIVATIALDDAVNIPGALVLVVSRSLRQSGELFRKVKQFYNLTRPLPLVKDTELGLELANGSRILSLPASEETIVGFSAVTRIILDEAARIPDGTYHAMRPMLAMSQGSILALSSPFGRRGFFYEAWTQTPTADDALDLAAAERLLSDLDFPVDEYSDASPTLDAPTFYDERHYSWTHTYLPATQNPRLSRRFLAHERLNVPDLWFRQEWLCEFVDLGNVVFRYEDLLAMVSEEVLPLYGADGQPHEDVRVVRGDVEPLALEASVWTT